MEPKINKGTYLWNGLSERGVLNLFMNSCGASTEPTDSAKHTEELLMPYEISKGTKDNNFKNG